jgi:hypothetical protein
MRIPIFLSIYLLQFALNIIDTFGREYPVIPISVTVTDSKGAPIPGARLGVSGELELERFADQKAEGLTDSAGNIVLSVRTAGRIFILARADGYYTTWLRDQPLENLGTRPHFTVRLERKLNPIPMYARAGHIITLPVLEEPVGFDLEVGDWVAPHGKGANADIMFKGKRRYSDPSNFDATVEISFARPYDGIQEVPVLPGSDLKVAHMAPEEGYQPTLVKWSRADSKKGRQSNIVVEDEPCFVFRTRTTADAVGKITNANYGKIHGDIQINPIGVAAITIQFTYYFNPTRNDRNLEFDKRRNLANDSRFPARDP